MPSTVVHVAFAGLIGAALLADHFDGKAVLVVMASVAFVDLDVFVGFWVEGAHRAAFHTLLLPGFVGALVWLDTRGRAHSWVQSRVGSGAQAGGQARTDAQAGGKAQADGQAGAQAQADAQASVQAKVDTQAGGQAQPDAQAGAGTQTSTRFRPGVGQNFRVSDRSRLRSRWGERGVRVAWVSVAAVTFAGIGLDAFFNGANLFYPVHDRFYEFSGKVLYSTKDGFVQTLVDVNFDALIEQLRPEEAAASGSQAGSGSGAQAGSGSESSKVVQPDSKEVRTTENFHYRTGVDPSKGAEQGSVERLFPIAMTGERALLALTGYVVVGLRVWEERRRD